LKVLIITSSGGGGLLQAAIAQSQAELARDPFVQIIRRDMMRDWYWKIIGKFGIRKWNEAQRQGNVKALEWLLNWQKTADIIFWPSIFYCALKVLFKENIDRVIDTQPIGTSAILCAVRIYNRLRAKNIILNKIVVDLPTKRNTHFFYPVKKLSASNRNFLRLVTIAPLTDEGQTSKDFWHLHCNTEEQKVHYEYFVIRRSFLQLQNKSRENREYVLPVRISNAEERDFLLHTIARGPLQISIDGDKVDCIVQPQDKVVTISLGSQPVEEATLGYIRKFIRLAKEFEATKIPIHLFILSGHYESNRYSLYRRIVDLTLRTKHYPEQLTIIPLSFQPDEIIAPIFHRSDLTCTRSGGQTAMELMCVMQGEIWIHSEFRESLGEMSEASLEQLLTGIPAWEAGNALYLHKLWGAKIVTVDTCMSHGREVISSIKNNIQVDRARASGFEDRK